MQQAFKQNVAPNVFNRKSRSWFGAAVKKLVGDTHLAKAIIRCGYHNRRSLERLVRAIMEVKAKDPPPSAPLAKRRARRQEALKARDQMRYGRSLSRRLANGQLEWNNLAGWQRDLWYRFQEGALEAELVTKSSAYKEVTPESGDVLGAATDILSRKIDDTEI